MTDPSAGARDPIVLADATFQSDDAGYLSIPTSGEGPAVLLLAPPSASLSSVRAMCDRLSREGFIALAPGFGDGPRSSTGIGADAAPAELDRSLSLMMRSVDRLAQQPGVTGDGVGVVGIGEPGGLAMLLAELKPSRVRAVVTFYGVEPDVHFEATRAAFLGHFAASDGVVAEETVRGIETAIRGGGREAIFHWYAGVERGFFEPESASYDAESVALAWTRTLEFLRERLGQT